MRQPSSLPPSQPHAPPPGFSLLEVLVALAVAAILATSLLGLVHQNVTMAGEAWEVQAHLDLAQEVLLTKSPYLRQVSPVSWTSGPADARWRLTRDERAQPAFRHGFEDGPQNATPFAPTRMQLFTSIRTRQMEWMWLEPPVFSDWTGATSADETPPMPEDDIP